DPGYRGVIVARSLLPSIRAAARDFQVQAVTLDELIRSLVNLAPVRDHAIRTFQGSALERLYVEQRCVFQRSVQSPDKAKEVLPLTRAVHAWLEDRETTFLALLGDFGTGKTSFVKKLACELALRAKEQPSAREPILVDLRESGASALTLE